MLFSRALLVTIALAPLAFTQDTLDNDSRIFAQAPTECQDSCSIVGSESGAEFERCLCQPDFGTKSSACKSCATPLLDKNSELLTAFAGFDDALANNCSSVSTSSSSVQATTTVDEPSSSSSSISSTTSSQSSIASSSSTSTQTSSSTNTASGSTSSPSPSGDSANGASSFVVGGLASLFAIAVALFAVLLPPTLEIRLDCPSKLMSSRGTPLPEDWCIRGMEWSGRQLFGRGYWRSDSRKGPRSGGGGVGGDHCSFLPL
ncbi:hypothetical protein JCM5350_004717 [Sporobolomyces pararoseus]